MRTSGPWTYAAVNTLHVLGVALLFGAVAVLDLRLVGVWRGTAMAALSGPTSAIAAAGLAVALPTGVLLLSTQATEYEHNPLLWIKLGFVAAGVANLLLLRRTQAWRTIDRGGSELRRTLVLGGVVSLGCWLCALVLGRMIAYW